MKASVRNILVVAVLAINAFVQAGARERSHSVVIDAAADLPEFAQRRSVAMYLHNTGSGQTILYLEQDMGQSIAFLDVTDPAAIRGLGRVAIGAPSPYDFVRALSDSAVLIRYRDRSGFAVINFKKYKKPSLTAAPGLLSPANIQPLGQQALLLTSTDSPSGPVQVSQFEVIDVSNPSKLTPLTTIPGVVQRLERPDTGTLFLLSNDGLTVIRRLSMEEEYQTEQEIKAGN